MGSVLRPVGRPKKTQDGWENGTGSFVVAEAHAGRRSLSAGRRGSAELAEVRGATATDGTRQYTWDAENRLIGAAPGSPGAGAKKVAFEYDDMGP